MIPAVDVNLIKILYKSLKPIVSYSLISFVEPAANTFKAAAIRPLETERIALEFPNKAYWLQVWIGAVKFSYTTIMPTDTKQWKAEKNKIIGQASLTL